MIAVDVAVVDQINNLRFGLDNRSADVLDKIGLGDNIQAHCRKSVLIVLRIP